MLDCISQKMIGNRVKAAREAAKLSQNELAKKLEIKDRQTISNIEKGKRALKSDELIQLCEILNRNIDFFIDPFIVAGEGQFSWRVADELNQNKLDDFELKSGMWIGLLRWLREVHGTHASTLKYTLRISNNFRYEDAQLAAENLVDEMNLGLIPTDHLVERIEKKLDIPVLFVDTIQSNDDEWISGAACTLRDMATILVNRNEAEGRRFFNTAHELFHILTWDAIKPDYRESHLIENQPSKKRNERLADNFAASLLMPENSIEKILETTKLGDVDHLDELATTFRVTPTALGWRLYNLQIISDEIRNLLSLRKQDYSISATPKPFSHTFVSMLKEALEGGNLSSRRAAKALGVSLGGLADLFREHQLAVPFDL